LDRKCDLIGKTREREKEGEKEIERWGERERERLQTDDLPKSDIVVDCI